MLARNYLTNTARNVIRTCLCGSKSFTYTKQYSSTTKNIDQNSLNQTLHKISSKYKVFKDSDAVEISDAYEELYKHPELIKEEPQVHDPFEGLNLERRPVWYESFRLFTDYSWFLGGVNGVYEIEDLVEALEKENSQDIFVAGVPVDLEYVDFICIVTGKSHRHMQAIAEFVRKVYKRKCHSNDIIPRIEGENSKEWVALDLGSLLKNYVLLSQLCSYFLIIAGNIALHIFSKEARTKYDLESLWAVGAQYDSEYNKEDPIVEMLERHSQCQSLSPKNS